MKVYYAKDEAWPVFYLTDRVIPDSDGSVEIDSSLFTNFWFTRKRFLELFDEIGKLVESHGAR